MEYRVTLKIAKIAFGLACQRKKTINSIIKKHPFFLTDSPPAITAFFSFSKDWRKKPLGVSGQRATSSLLCRAEHFSVRMDFKLCRADFYSADDLAVLSMIRLLCAVILSRRGGILLHSCSVLGRRGQAYVFFGPSESGKTTVARLSPDKRILSDETTAVFKEKGRWYAYATPFAGEYGPARCNTGGPLKAVFALNKDSRFSHSRLGVGPASRKLFCSIFLEPCDDAMIERTLGSLQGLCRQVPCYDLHFKAQSRLWSYIDGFIG